MDAPLVAAEVDGLRFSDWIDTAGISRSTAFELVKILGLDLEQRKVSGSQRPVLFADGNHLQTLNVYAGKLRSGETTLAALKRDPRHAVAMVPAATPAVLDDPEPSGTVPDDLPLLDRLQAVQLAIQTGAPLTTAEVRQLLGVWPGAAAVTRGRVTASRIARNQWILTPAVRPSSERKTG
ncbi:MAG: hypothetical protein KGQ81_00400 [Cyanobacteria bacterium REEB498]|nr:hypothetical protein [Cyanobacteria bacterium REEB498]